MKKIEVGSIGSKELRVIMRGFNALVATTLIGLVAITLFSYDTRILCGITPMVYGLYVICTGIFLMRSCKKQYAELISDITPILIQVSLGMVLTLEAYWFFVYGNINYRLTSLCFVAFGVLITLIATLCVIDKYTLYIKKGSTTA